MTANPIILGTGHRIWLGASEREVITLPVHDVMHSHLIGKSNCGKTRFLSAMYVMLMHRGISCTLIDPTGDATRLILQYLLHLGWFEQKDAFSKFIYVDIPGGYTRQLYVPFNLLDIGHDPYVTADLVLEACKRYWSSLNSGNQTNILSLE